MYLLDSTCLVMRAGTIAYSEIQIFIDPIARQDLSISAIAWQPISCTWNTPWKVRSMTMRRPSEFPRCSYDLTSSRCLACVILQNGFWRIGFTAKSWS